ncbi:cation:proton antiporter [Staphylothermus hellenicus]|uniref:Sodium/hydrogen exchanger n=1 Tax=Staphylothermus hellenicus (strain DSM 12710 / JCM 10830 / BK20S6-10-b1 / P8) TaxID=591019 RepID=D7DBZ7_STAHD|nr:cation:proton antiporter [Staphylothermus hellenicus]ADI31694.1 sodium/hydrogen exchanger [Staphylothermus hellenicus DSM 12710]
MDVEYLIFEIVMMLMLAKILEIPFRKHHLHPLAGHVITGIVLGPYLLGLVRPSSEMLGIAYFGLLLLMFYTGLTTDYRELKRRGKIVLLMGGMGVLVTFTLIYLVMYFLGYAGLPGIFIAASLSNTATETMAAIVAKKGDAISRSLLVGASFVDDVMAVFIIGILAGLAVENSLSMNTLIILAGKALFFLLSVFLISSLLVNKYPKIYKVISQDYFWFATFSILLALSLAVAAKLFGLSELIGAYLAGILISRGREFHDPMLRTRIAISEFISDFTVVLDALFIPLFFAYIGLSYSPGKVSFYLYLVLLSLAILGKFIGTAPISYISLKDKRRSIAVGLAMSGRGALETALLKLGLDYKIISPILFNTAITVSITTTVLAPILYSIVYRE